MAGNKGQVIAASTDDERRQAALNGIESGQGRPGADIANHDGD